MVRTHKTHYTINGQCIHFHNNFYFLLWVKMNSFFIALFFVHFHQTNMCARERCIKKKLDFIIYTPLVFLVLGSWFIYGPISSGFFLFQMPLNFMYLIGSMSLPLLNSKYGHFLIRKDDSRSLWHAFTYTKPLSQIKI